MMLQRNAMISVIGLAYYNCTNTLSSLSLTVMHRTRNYSQLTTTSKGNDDELNTQQQWHPDIGYPFFCLDPYAERNFIYKDNKYAKKAFINYDRQEFTNKINELYHDKSNGILLEDGYAPFCKHLFVPNFVGQELKCQIIKITKENEKYLKTDYVARREEELPVLMRWFDGKLYGAQLKPFIESAGYLDIILYSRQQIIKENAAMNVVNEQQSPWGIISIKPQMVDYEIPMEPSTMMRNALPLNEGGSGVSLCHEKYTESVKFWRKHARLQQD